MKFEIGQIVTFVHKFSFSRRHLQVVQVEPEVRVQWPGLDQSVVVDGHCADAPMWEVEKEKL